MGSLVHKEDIYSLDIDQMDFDDIISKLKEDGYKMGKLSLMALVNGEVEHACGFIYEEDQPETINTRLMESIEQLKSGQIVLTTTPRGGNFFVEQYLKEHPLSLHGWNKTPIKITQSRNKREGHYCGPLYLYRGWTTQPWKKIQNHTRKGHKNVVPLKDIHA